MLCRCIHWGQMNIAWHPQLSSFFPSLHCPWQIMIGVHDLDYVHQIGAECSAVEWMVNCGVMFIIHTSSHCALTVAHISWMTSQTLILIVIFLYNLVFSFFQDSQARRYTVHCFSIHIIWGLKLFHEYYNPCTCTDKSTCLAILLLHSREGLPCWK